MYKTKLVNLCYVVPDLVVEIEIFNFCFFVCLSVPHVLLTSQKVNGPIMVPKAVLKSGLLLGR